MAQEVTRDWIHKIVQQVTRAGPFLLQLGLLFVRDLNVKHRELALPASPYAAPLTA